MVIIGKEDGINYFSDNESKAMSYISRRIKGGTPLSSISFIKGEVVNISVSVEIEKI